MRLWSIHPRLLDAAGLVALWREGLLAQAVLAGKTRGYTAHPQLARFRACARPLAAIGGYLRVVAEEARSRGYRFDQTKILVRGRTRLSVTDGQLLYELAHLRAKLWRRDRSRWRTIAEVDVPEAHPAFDVVTGGVAEWERGRGLESPRRTRVTAPVRRLAPGSSGRSRSRKR